MRLNKKIGVVAASVAAVVAIGTGAWAYVTINGSGDGTATTAANGANLTVSATAQIDDLDVAAPIVVKAKSNKANRRITTVTVAVKTTGLPTGCQASWFSISSNGTANEGWTLTTAGTEQTLDTGLTIKLVNDPDANQDGCLSGSIPLSITAGTTPTQG